MVNEIVEAFATVPPGVVVDATLGGAGHTTALLDQYEWMSVLGIDRDAIAIAHAREVADRYPGRFMVEHGRFDRVEEFLQVGDQPRYEGGVAEDFKQNCNDGCDCHNFPFIFQMDVAIAANHQPSSIRNGTQSGSLLIKPLEKSPDKGVTSRI